MICVRCRQMFAPGEFTGKYYVVPGTNKPQPLCLRCRVLKGHVCATTEQRVALQAEMYMLGQAPTDAMLASLLPVCR